MPAASPLARAPIPDHRSLMGWYTDLSDWFADAPRHVGDTLQAGLTDVRDGATWAWDGVHAAGHDAHVFEARSEAVLEALWEGAKLALIGAENRLRTLDVSAIINLLMDALLDALKTVVKGILIGAAIGAVDGAFVGGVGALPGAIAGAAAGFDAAMTYLTILGLKDMASFVVEDATVALRSLASGLAMAWHAPADPNGHWVQKTPRETAVMAAAHVLSEGLIALAILIFMGLAAFLLHNGGKLGKLAEAISKAKPLGPKFVGWVDRNAGKLVEWSKRADTGNVRPGRIDAPPPEAGAGDAAGGGGSSGPRVGSRSADVWKERPWQRGKDIESALAETEYSEANGWYHVGAENNGYFPLVDFQQGNNLVSLKTVDTNGAGWLDRMQDHIYELGTNGATVDGQPANMILDLRTQPGGAQAAQQLVDYGKANGVTVLVRDFP